MVDHNHDEDDGFEEIDMMNFESCMQQIPNNHIQINQGIGG